MSVLSVKIGSRSSRLAQEQTGIVANLIKETFGDEVELRVVPVRTLGDRSPPRAWKESGRAGAKGAFTADIESLLLGGKVDIAVHSMKDLASEETGGLVIGATPPREDPRDVLVTNEGEGLGALPKGARVGTSSLRRKVQLLEMRRDLRVVELHGNIDTRLRKVAEGEDRLDAVVLAAAGLRRIGEIAHISQTFTIEEMVPAVGQGTIAVQMRKGDRDVGRVLSGIDDEVTRVESSCERAFAQRLGADCNLPVGGCATVSGPTIKLAGMLARPDGAGFTRTKVAGPRGEAASLGSKLADELFARSIGPRRAAS